MKTDFDVIVAGDGLAGILTATSIAFYSDQNVRTLVVGRNPVSEIGKKTYNGWICGDATSRRSLDYLAKIGIRYASPEIEHPVDAVFVYSPDHESKVEFKAEGAGVVLNRKILPQRQMRDAKNMGVEFQTDVEISELMYENDRVSGLRGRNNKDNSVFEKTSKIVVDATGCASRLRQNLQIPSHIQTEINKDDLEVTGREIFEFDIASIDKTYFDADNCLIHLDQELAPGGYCWVFPKGRNKVNIGLGVQQKALQKRNMRFGKKDTLQSLIKEYIGRNPVFKNLRVADVDVGNEVGSWQVSVRRQNDSMVANGYAIVGDAAWMPRPIDAGGISPAIHGAVILGEVIAEAIEANDVSEAGLWPYNLRYMRDYGYTMSSFEVLRKLLQTLPNEEIDYGMKYFLTDEDIDRITSRQPPEFDFLGNFKKGIRAIGHSDLAGDLLFFKEMSRKLRKTNEGYPDSPSGFELWKSNLLKEMKKVDERFSLA